MNLFILEHRNTNESLQDWMYRNGQSHCDQHQKLILEAWQQLNTCANVIGIKTDNDSVAYKNHPCTAWVRKTLANWQFAIEYARGLALSMAERYGKDDFHKSLIRIEDNIPERANGRLSSDELTPFAKAMPDWLKRKHDCAIDAYREYYCLYKSWFARKDGDTGLYKVKPAVWKHGIAPEWYKRCDLGYALDKGYVSAWKGSKQIVLSRDIVSNFDDFC